MGYNLTNEYIDESFQQLTQISGSVLLDGTGSRINDLSLTASRATTASHAISASHSEQTDNATSASYAVTASYSVSSSHSEQADNATSSSHAVQADNADTALSANTSTTAGFASAAATASYVAGANVDGPVANATTASFATTSSFALNFNPLSTASYAIFAEDATSASYAVTSSYPLRGFIDVSTSGLDFTFTRGNGTTETIIATITGSVENAVSASHALKADSASFVTGSNVFGPLGSNSILSASYAVSASHAVRANGSGTAEDLIITVKNVSSDTIAAGVPVYANGVTGENVNVLTASNDSSATMPAIGITQNSINANGNGTVVINGRESGINTSALLAGQPVYVGLNGTLTATRPTGSLLIQNIGTAAKIDAATGEIILQGAGRTNDLPNITQNYVWLGDSNGVPQAVVSSSIKVDDAISSSYAVTASHALQADNATTASYAITSSQAISSSYAVSSSLSQLAVNLTSGDKDHSGTIDQQFSAPGAFQQKNLATISGVTYGGNNYAISELIYMNYPFGAQFTNALGFSQWDSYSYNYGAELLLAPQRIQFNFTPSGSVASGPNINDTTGLLGMQANGVNSQVLLYGSELQIGKFKGVTIGIGNRSGVDYRQTENLNINAISQSVVVDEYSLNAGTGVYVDGGTKGGLETITNNGASPTFLNLNAGNFYELDLTAASTTLTLNTGDIKANYGQTFQIKVTNTTNSLSYDSNFKFPGGVAPVITANGTDVLTGVVWGTNDVYLTKVGNFF